MTIKLMITSIFAVFLLFFATAPAAEASETQLISGAGPSTKIAQLFFTEFAKLPAAQGYEFVVPPKSIKHAGGIRACEQYIFGRTGRPLKPSEQKNKGEIFLAQIPVSIVSGSGVKIQSLDLEQLQKIVLGQYTNWSQFGGPNVKIVNVGREETEALFSILKKKYPFFKSAKFNRIFGKDNHITNFLKSPQGKYAIAFGAKPNFENQTLVHIIPVNNFSVGVNVGLVYDESNKNHALVKSVQEYARSSQWASFISSSGYMAPEN